MHRLVSSSSALFMLLLVVACEPQSTAATPDAALLEAALFNGAGPNPRPQAWADGELFDVIVVSATFKASAGNFDELYAGGNGFGDGVPLISDSKPGDQDYNGGRWHLNVLREGVDPDKYASATSDADLDPNDFVSTDTYFECPLLPRRGRG